MEPTQGATAVDETPAAQDTQEVDLMDLIDTLRDEVHARYAGSARAEQFDSHLATVEMVLGHMADEAERESE